MRKWVEAMRKYLIVLDLIKDMTSNIANQGNRSIWTMPSSWGNSPCKNFISCCWTCLKIGVVSQLVDMGHRRLITKT